jgi:chromosomal replication initiation ATPase DnaA
LKWNWHDKIDMTQFKFGFTAKPAFSADDFVVADANREAFSWITEWPKWPGNALLLHGPKSSGKTHLAHIWAKKSGAEFSNDAAKPALVLENIESFVDQEKLFHLINRMKEKNGWFLLTANAPVAQLQVTLPDLASRLKAMPSVGLNPPDDQLLKSVLMKLFSDRQLKVPAAAIDFILSRMNRSFLDAAALVEKIDTLSAEEKRGITIPLVKKAL